MIFDCFIFNDELDLLELRLKFLGSHVDRFVLVESTRTLAGRPKPLHYQNNKERFAAWQNQIIHLIAPENNMQAWEYEFFQRNYIKQGLADAASNDIVFISDADEILNIPSILKWPSLQLPAVIELPARYYFLNLETSDRFWVNIAGTADFIRQQDIGLRYKKYETICPNRISTIDLLTGWHFSYLFGYNTKLYLDKISAFAHQEYNTTYWMDETRISRCIRYNMDIFERATVKIHEENKNLSPLLPFIKGSPLESLLVKPAHHTGNPVSSLFYVLRKKYWNRLRHFLFHKNNKSI